MVAVDVDCRSGMCEWDELTMFSALTPTVHLVEWDPRLCQVLGMVCHRPVDGDRDGDPTGPLSTREPLICFLLSHSETGPPIPSPLRPLSHESDADHCSGPKAAKASFEAHTMFSPLAGHCCLLCTRKRRCTGHTLSARSVDATRNRGSEACTSRFGY
jgi:hypothetical protein